MQNRSIARLLFVASGSLLVVATASATIINRDEDAIIRGPANLDYDQTEDAAAIRGMDEATGSAPGGLAPDVPVAGHWASWPRGGG